MKRNVIVGVAGVVALLFVGIKVGALPDPLKKAPSFLKFNSVTVKGVSKAPAGQALLADGNSGSAWGNVEGVNVASHVAGSPVANGTVLTSDGTGKCAFTSLPTTATPTGPAGGGLSGTYPNPSLVLPQGLGTGDSPAFAALTLTTGPLTIPAGSIPASSLGSSPIFGNGSDGDVTISANTTLTGDMYYNNLTVNNGMVLNAGGYRIFVKGTCTLNGAISNNGLTGGAIESPGAGASSGTLGGGGNGGTRAPSGYATSGVSTLNSLGGNGGSGGSGGGAGGTSSAPAAPDGGVQVVNALPNALTCRLLSATLITGGAGGGAGGVIGNVSGGGGGGGVVMVAVRAFAGAGSIQANGGSGTSSIGGSGGGGGGGGGCVVIVTTGPLPATITASASGGGAGAGGTPVAAAGADGRVVVVY